MTMTTSVLQYTVTHQLVLLIPFVLLCPSLSSQGCGIHYSQPGDITIGGLIPLHTYDEAAQTCSTIRSIDSLKRVEALVYAVTRINSDPVLLPDITLGFDIYDTCSYDSIALRESLNFIPLSEDTCSASTFHCPTSKRQPVVGVVGAQRSASSLQATLLLAQYRIPLVSFLSTSDELSNTLRYPYFLRMVGPDSYQVNAMVDIIMHYRWTYVAFINSDDTYGTNGRIKFLELASERGICVGYSNTLHQSDTSKDYTNLLEGLMRFQDESFASVVILFVYLEMAQRLFDTARKMNVTRRFIWIGSDGWGNYGDAAIKGNEEAALGCFTVVPESNSCQDFNDYFKSLTPDTSTNPWLTEYLQTFSNCSVNTSTGVSCDEPGLLVSLEQSQSSHETLVMDSVYALAHALEDMRHDICPDTPSGLCQQTQTVDGELFLRYLLNTKFTSLANGRIEFMKNGDVAGRYSIRHLRFVDDKYIFTEVGKWNETSTYETVIDTQVPWYASGKQMPSTYTTTTTIPISVCSEPCKIKEREIPHPNGIPCCWTCEECHENEIIHSGRCLSCIDKSRDIFGWPNEDRSECVPILPGANLWTAPIITVSSIGMLITLVTFSLYFHNCKNILIKASSREVSCVIFIGIFLSYLCSILYVMHPTIVTCYLLHILPPLATSFIYVSLAVKTVRLFRIFRASMKSAKRPRYIKPKSQILLIAAVAIVPILWSVAWLFVQKPEIVKTLPRENHLELACSKTNGYIYGAMSWDVILILTCCVLAGLTRKLPTNYNESKFITFCAFCSLVAVLAFSSTYLAIDNSNAYSLSGYFALCLLVNATATLSCLFIVKLYAIYFVKIEQWNARTPDPSFSTPSSNGDRRLSKALSNHGYEGSPGNSNADQIDENANGRVLTSLLKADHDYNVNDGNEYVADLVIEQSAETHEDHRNVSETMTSCSSVFVKDFVTGHSYELSGRTTVNTSETVALNQINSMQHSISNATSEDDEQSKSNLNAKFAPQSCIKRQYVDTRNNVLLYDHDDGMNEHNVMRPSSEMLHVVRGTRNKTSPSPNLRANLSIGSIHTLPDEVSIVVSGEV